MAPYYPSDALGLLKASIRDDDPVLFLYAEGSLGVREAVPEEMEPIPLHHAAKIMREGTDLTIVAVQAMVPTALKAVEELEKAGISAELIDPRWIWRRSPPLSARRAVCSWCTRRPAAAALGRRSSPLLPRRLYGT